MKRLIITTLAVLAAALFWAPPQATADPTAASTAAPITRCDGSVCVNVETRASGNGVKVTAVNWCNRNPTIVRSNAVTFYGTAGATIYGQYLGDFPASTCGQTAVPNVQMGSGACAEFTGNRYKVRTAVRTGAPC